MSANELLPRAGGGPALDLSVIVVTYNGRALIERCLNAIGEAIRGLKAEVIVVDNASPDGTADLVAAHSPDVLLIRSPENLGFGKANNRAIAVSRGRYLALVNPDAIVRPDAFRHLLDVAEAHPEAGALGGRLEYEDGRFQHSAFHFPDLRQAFFGFFDVIPIDSERNGRYPVACFETTFRAEHLLGAFILLRRTALEQVGAFDPAYFMYFEETDLCLRLRRAGWQNLYTPAARAVHVGAASTSAHRERMSVEFHRSQAYFYRSHYGYGGYVQLKAIVLAGTGYRLARSVRAYLRGRIGGGLLRERLGSYAEIARL
ncbi:MAG: glycosyltransferase family 2 protein [Chloroflexi bacterium]|nr:glycosyltransferase family 2 protein [Chloroflexota bacterium]